MPTRMLLTQMSTHFAQQGFSFQYKVLNVGITLKSVSQSRSTFLWFEFYKATPVINCIFESKEAGSTNLCWSYIHGHLLSHMYSTLLGCSSHSIRFIMIVSICSDHVIVIVAKACHLMGSSWSSPAMKDHSSATTWRGAEASSTRSAKASSQGASSVWHTQANSQVELVLVQLILYTTSWAL